mmetsp:Transcript_28637/g.92948  ORF Transcript_28637/g.92948 Transcript_28637/m.92948 type:complete len:253 (-) Transcript_28637:622-1380(-)
MTSSNRPSRGLGDARGTRHTMAPSAAEYRPGTVAFQPGMRNDTRTLLSSFQMAPFLMADGGTSRQSPRRTWCVACSNAERRGRRTKRYSQPSPSLSSITVRWPSSVVVAGTYTLRGVTGSDPYVTATRSTLISHPSDGGSTARHPYRPSLCDGSTGCMAISCGSCGPSCSRSVTPVTWNVAFGDGNAAYSTSAGPVSRSLPISARCLSASSSSSTACASMSCWDMLCPPPSSGGGLISASLSSAACTCSRGV